VGAGPVRLVLDVRLPDGYHRNPEVDTQVTVDEDVRTERFSFGADREIAWTVNVAEDQTLPVDLALYYCQGEDGEGQAALLCLIYDRKMVIPVEVVQDGPKEARIPVVVRNTG